MDLMKEADAERLEKAVLEMERAEKEAERVAKEATCCATPSPSRAVGSSSSRAPSLIKPCESRPSSEARLRAWPREAQRKGRRP